MMGLGMIIVVLPVLNIFLAIQSLLLFMGGILTLSAIFWMVISAKVKAAS